MRCAFWWLACPASSAACLAGGDIVSAACSPAAIRLIVGDVMGHGPRAARTSVEVTRAFGELARVDHPLQEIALGLEAFLASRNSAARNPARDGAEEDCLAGYFGDEFVTALIVSIPRDPGAEVEIVSCGHPPPLLLRGPLGDRHATTLDALSAAPPLGLLDFADCPALPVPLQVAPGESLLLYTDGVTDARNALGRPFPLADRVAGLAHEVEPECTPAGTALLQVIRADLLRHAGGRLTDDATMLLIDFHEVPASSRDQVPCPASPSFPLATAAPLGTLLSEAADWRGSILG